MLDNRLNVQYRVDACAPGVVMVTVTGLVNEAALADFWRVLDSPLVADSLASVFDFRRAVMAFRMPPRIVAGAPQQKPGCFLCSPGQYQVLLGRAALLNDLGVRRAVFCSPDAALEWAAQEARAIAHHGRYTVFA